MKSAYFKLMLCIIFLPFVLKAQQPAEVIDTNKHKLVIQFNDADSLLQRRVTLQVEGMRTAWPNSDIEVVCLGDGLELLMTAKSKMSKMVAELTEKGVVFAACYHTMKSRKVMKEDLLSQAVVVSNAIIELAMKQEQGWSYFKGGR